MSALSYSVPAQTAVDRTAVARLLLECEAELGDLFDNHAALQSYCEKIVSKAQFFQCTSGADLAGFAAAYCNDFEKKTAFLTMICVSPKFRRMKIANTLLCMTIEHVRKLGFDRFTSRVARRNAASLKLHLRLGFEVQETMEDEIHLSRALYTGA